MIQDLQYGLRMLFRNAGFTLVAVLALALGIGLNTAVFTAYKAMVTRQLDARDANEMVNLAVLRQSGDSSFSFSYPDYEALRDSSRSYSGLIALGLERLTLSNAGPMVSQRDAAAQSVLGRILPLPNRTANAEFASTFIVSENYFKVLGVEGIRGRAFDSMTSAELMASPSVLISENYWQRRFSSDPAMIGRTVHLNGAAVTIVGVTPRDFTGSEMFVPAFWLPMSLASLVHADDNWLRDREAARWRLFGRLASGVSIKQAEAEATILIDRLRALHDPQSLWARPGTAVVSPGSPFPVPPGAIRGLNLVFILIMAATAMVLAVACANVAGLQLARSRSRQSELQTRRALGASRLRVIRQLLTESVMLGLLSGATALLFTWAFLKVAVRLVANLMPAEYGSLVFDVTPDPGIFAFVVSISLIAGILFGLVPALESSGSALVSSNRNSTSSARSRRLQDFLVATQVALSLVLLIAGGMFLHSAIHSLDTDPGYQSKHVVNIDIKFSETSKYTAARRSALVRELRRRVEELPGVTAVTSARPPADNRFQTVAVSLDGQLSVLNYRYVQPDYFQTLHIPMVLGTAFQSEARQEEEFVILSESAAKLLWPGQNPVGRSLRLGPVDERFHRLADLHADGPAYRVIGVAGDTRGAELGGSDSRQVYLLLPTDRIQDYSILMRTETDPTEIIRATDSMMASFDSGMFATSATLAEMLRASPLFVASSLSAAVASTVGVFGLLLAAMGIHGTVSFIVVLRTREVGIRMSLGAQKHDVLGLILRETTRPVFVGLIAGMLLATVVSYSLRSLLYGIDIVDSVSFIAVSLLFLAIASLAAYQPVRRAMRVDPTVALRYE